MRVIFAFRNSEGTVYHAGCEFHIYAEKFTGIARHRRTRLCESKRL
jgi:hypothetical protein